MINYVVFNDNGRILFSGKAPELPPERAGYNVIELDGGKPDVHYVLNGSLINIPNRPYDYAQFDYLTKQWIDPRTLEEIKVQKWDEIKKQRTELEFGGFEFEYGIYDSDQISQGRIMGAALSSTDQMWTLADNSVRLLTATQLQQLYFTLSQHISSVHERGRIAREALDLASTKEEIEAITL